MVRGPIGRALVRKRVLLAAAATLAVWGSIARLARARSSDLVATFLDVGQGDAIVIELPHGHAMLVDGGGSFDPSFDPGELVIEPFLRTRHIERLDLVVMTHPHPDHMNGLARVLERFPVAELWDPGETSDLPAYSRLLALSRARGVGRGPPGHRDLGGATIDVLGPLGGASLARSTNDNSLVLAIRYAGRTLLLPGDIERPSERELLAAGAPLRAEVLKAPHHGSRTSSSPEFLRAVAPRFAVFCAGADNRFGFPHPDVVARFPCPTRVTGRDGAVTVTVHADGSWGQAALRDSMRAP
jgi:competence protein ComEC